MSTHTSPHKDSADLPEVKFPIVDRRTPPDPGATFLLIHSVLDMISAMDRKLSQHMTDETLELAEEIAKLMNKAFVAGDPEGHRAFHQAQIEAAQERAEFWKTMRKELGKWGLLGFVGFVAVALWSHVVGIIQYYVGGHGGGR